MQGSPTVCRVAQPRAPDLCRPRRKEITDGKTDIFLVWFGLLSDIPEKRLAWVFCPWGRGGPAGRCPGGRTGSHTGSSRWTKTDMHVWYTVKKAFRYSRPRPGCHLPNSPWAGIMTSCINYSRLGRVYLFSGHEPIYFIENKEKTLRASYDRGTQIVDYMDQRWYFFFLIVGSAVITLGDSVQCTVEQSFFKEV